MDDKLVRVRANGIDFACLAEGEGPLVVLVHGFPDTAHTWDRVLPALAAAGYRAVAPFTRGYAPTSIPGDGVYDTGTLGQDILGLIEALGESRAVVVGHDWGASAAYSAAALGPERVRLLVTVAIPHPASIVPTPRLLWGMRHFLAFRRKKAPDRVRRNDFAMVDRLVKRWSPGWDVPAGETDAVKESFRQPGVVEAALGYYRAVGRRLPDSHRKKIEVPTVCFAGETDVVKPSAYPRAARRFTGAYEVVTMPGGHFMHRQDPERFNRELVRVLEQHAPVKKGQAA